MSAPDPAGGGARIRDDAGAATRRHRRRTIDYINMHGTATPQNDAMESRVIAGLFGCEVPVSSTKPFTGHTLGAAAAIEAALCWLAMQDDNIAGKLPPHLWDGAADPALPALNVVPAGDALGPSAALGAEQFLCLRRFERALVLGRTMTALPDIRHAGAARGPMVLLDLRRQRRRRNLCAEVTIRPDSMFCGGGRGCLGRHRIHGAGDRRACRLAGACSAAMRSRSASCSVRANMRQRASFAVGSKLHVHVQRALQGDNGLGAFECRIDDANGQAGATLPRHHDGFPARQCQ
jgi:3-oxoacyl-[acyl-carrier-protein] synthase-1